MNAGPNLGFAVKIGVPGGVMGSPDKFSTIYVESGADRMATVILCGGASSRMGTDKAVLDWNGAAAIDRLAALSERLGLQMVLTAGADHGLPVVFDARPGDGPCGGILAAAGRLSAAGYGRALILAVDAPTVTTDDIRPLMESGGPGAAYDGLPLPMVIELAAIPAEAQSNWALKRLVQAAGLVTLPCSDQARPRLRGANTPEERRHLLGELQPAAPSSSGTRSPSPWDGGLHPPDEPHAGSIRPQHHG